MRAGSNTLIVDAYNANPSSMAVAIDNFSSFQAGRKLALLGDMRELGEDSVKEHIRIVDKVRESGLDACFVGEEFRKALDATGLGYKWFATSEELASYLAGSRVEETAYLVKGSRGIRMENVLKVIAG